MIFEKEDRGLILADTVDKRDSFFSFHFLMGKQGDYMYVSSCASSLTYTTHRSVIVRMDMCHFGPLAIAYPTVDLDFIVSALFSIPWLSREKEGVGANQ